jgi:hypothetical protein
MHLHRLPYFIIIIILFIAPSANTETFYRWVDEKGVTHVTDQPPVNKPANGKDIKEIYMDAPIQSSGRISNQVRSSGLQTSTGNPSRIPIQNNNYRPQNPPQQEISPSPTSPYSVNQPQLKALPPRPTQFQSDAQAMQEYDRRVREIKEYNAQLSQEYERRVKEYEKRVKEVEANNALAREHNAKVARERSNQLLLQRDADQHKKEHDMYHNQPRERWNHSTGGSTYKPYLDPSADYADRYASPSKPWMYKEYTDRYSGPSKPWSQNQYTDRYQGSYKGTPTYNQQQQSPQQASPRR